MEMPVSDALKFVVQAKNMLISDEIDEILVEEAIKLLDMAEECLVKVK